MTSQSPPDIYCSEECKVLHESVITRVVALEQTVSDHAQRLSTAQTSPFKRLWWWLAWGEPWTDWNAAQPNSRLWNRARRHAPKGWVR